MLADFCWKNCHRKSCSSLCILLTLPLVMALVADVKTDLTTTDVKTDLTTEEQVSNEAAASPLFRSESESVVPLIEAQESNFHGVAQNDDEQFEEKRTNGASSVGNEDGSCKSQNLPTAESITKSPVCPSGDSGDTGANVAAVFFLECKHAHKEACVQKESPVLDIVCDSAEKVSDSGEIRAYIGKGDGEDAVGDFGESKVKLTESGYEKASSVKEEKEKEAPEYEQDLSKLEKSDDNPLSFVTVETTEMKVEHEKTHQEHQESDEDDEDGDEDGEDDVLMGFHFNEDEVLVDKNGAQFEFRRYNDRARNQKRYERLGEKITDYIYGLLETRCKLKKVYIPLNVKEDEPKSFIFVSDGAFTTEDKLIIFIHGSGVVRAGQWARSLIINQSLRHGTQIPYIERALKEGYEVIVLNTNLNTLSKNRWPSHDEMIWGSKDPESHALYVWENLIEDMKAKHIAIVAHSYGGVVTLELTSKKYDEFCKRVFAIAFTDSVHHLNIVYDSPEVIDFFCQRARNWVTSSLPLDEPIKCDGLRHMNDAPRVSAGHEKHEWTSWSSFESVFKFLDDKYHSFISQSDETLKIQKPTANL